MFKKIKNFCFQNSLETIDFISLFDLNYFSNCKSRRCEEVIFFFEDIKEVEVIDRFINYAPIKIIKYE